MSYACGDKYDGEWRNDFPNGKGTLTLVNGLKYEGDWENGKVCFFSSSLKNERKNTRKSDFVVLTNMPLFIDVDNVIFSSMEREC
jgi:hypothetical protein